MNLNMHNTMIVDTQWTALQRAFFVAIQRYHNNPIYAYFNQGVSLVNLGLQGVLLFYMFQHPLNWVLQIAAFALAYILADFINGIVHLYMDNNAHYTSVIGPLVAAFHLHHHQPRYTQKPIWRVYIDENGFKVWLMFFMLAVLVSYALSGNGMAHHTFILHLVVYFSVLSSCAEVSHYLCHNSSAPLVKTLQRAHILLPKKHHAHHHQQDNINYAFLNGMTDGLINRIAKHYFKGYKTTTDEHLALYSFVMKQTQQRSV